MRNHETGKRVAPRRSLPTRRLLSLLMALVMSLSLVQITAFAGETDQQSVQQTKQITNAGGTAYYKADGQPGTENDWAVKLSRTLAETDTENLFDVNLEVTTRDNTVSTDAAAATVLVIDTSGSMDYCAVCGQKEDHDNHHDKTYTVKKCNSGQGTVWADKNRDRVCDNCGEPEQIYKCPNGNGEWTGRGKHCENCKQKFNDHNPEATHTAQQVTDKKNHDFKSRLTAAKEAAEAFLDSYAKNAGGNTSDAPRYVAIVGFADKANTKCAWVDVTQGTDAVETAINGLTADGGTNTEAGLQLASNLLGAETVRRISNKFVVLLTDGQPTYYIDKHQDNKRDGLDTVPSGYYTWFLGDIWHSGVAGPGNSTSSAETAPVETVSKALKDAGVKVYGVTYGVTEQIPNGNDVKKDIDKWMTEDCGMAGVYSVSDPKKLNAAFSDIINTIQQETVGTTTVTAVNNETGEGALTNLYTFVDFNNNNSNGATVANNQVTWDLSKATAESGSTDKEKTYKLSYQVWMHTETTDFAKETPYSLGAATLSFKVNDGDPKTVAFPAVSAKGYLGSLTFTKVDADDNSTLSGATFKLSVPSDSFRGHTKPLDDTSSDEGVVAISGIPSGYTYTLSETKAPEGYQAIEGTIWNVSVSYGEVSVTDANGNRVGNRMVENTKQPTPPVTKYTLTVHYYIQGTTDKLQADLIRTIDANSGYVVNVPSSIGEYSYRENTGDLLTGLMDGDKEVNLYYAKDDPKPDPEPDPTYTVKYFVEDAIGKFIQYGEDKVYQIAKDQTKATLLDLYTVFEKVPAGYLFDKEITDAYNYQLSDGTVAPGNQVEVEDGDVFKLYYKLDTSEPVTDYVDYVIEYYYRDSPTDTYVLAEDETIRSNEDTRVRRGDSLRVPGTIRTGYTLDESVDGGSKPGTYTLTADETTFKLYYTMEEQPETSLTYTVKYFYRDSDTAEYVEETTESYSGSAKEGVELTVKAGAKSGYTFTKGDEPGTYKLTAAKHDFELYYTKQSSEPIIDPPVNPPVGPTVTYYSVTVNYYDKASGEVIHTAYTDSKASGSSYDVTAQDKIAIEGYTYVETTGDALTGVLNGNKVINVYYTKDSAPVDPTPVDPAPVDPPKTGDAMTFWVAAASVSALGLAALALTGKKRREEV